MHSYIVRLVKRSRAERPEGSLPAFVWGDVVCGSTLIRSVTERRSLFPSSCTGYALNTPCDVPSCCQDMDHAWDRLCLFAGKSLLSRVLTATFAASVSHPNHPRQECVRSLGRAGDRVQAVKTVSLRTTWRPAHGRSPTVRA